jgi:para-aminobenzoate synthetase component 1
VADGVAKHLDAHIKRFSAAWDRIFPGPVPDLTWEDVIDQVLTANSLNDGVAAVKVLAAYGTRSTSPFDHQVVVYARPYSPRWAGKGGTGLKLVTFPEPRQTPLADFKTTNYLYYYLAGNWAREHGADEALILNPDGTLSETNSANILIIKGKTVLQPDSLHVLPGIMLAAVCEILAGWGYTVKKEPLLPNAVLEADQVLLTNALMGAVPVLSFNGRDIPHPSDLCRHINTEVL